MTASNQVPNQEDPAAEALAAAYAAGRQDAADAIYAHADNTSPADGNDAQRRRRRHLHIAARVAAPPIDEATMHADAVAALHGVVEVLTGTGAHADHEPVQAGAHVVCSCGFAFQGDLGARRG